MLTQVGTHSGQQSAHGHPSLPELHLLRSIACLGVVAIHAITVVLWNPGYPGPAWARIGLKATQMLLMFSTPAFVLLSAILVGYNYGRPPSGFLAKRVRYVLIPFIVMNILYAGFRSLIQLRTHGDLDLFVSQFLSTTGSYLVGYSHLWFILPIFQFYLLYALVGHRLPDFSPALVVGGSLLLNIAYLSLFNFMLAKDSGSGNLWYSFLFPGWIFYFAVGFYWGTFYRSWQRYIQARIGTIFAALALSTALFITLHGSGVLDDVSSRRVDLVPYTLCMSAVLLHVASKLRSVPRILLRVSQVSFGIYILHPFFLEIMWRGLPGLARLSQPGAFIVLAIGGVTTAFVATNLLARVRFGTLFIGRVRPLPRFSGEQRFTNVA